MAKENDNTRAVRGYTVVWNGMMAQQSDAPRLLPGVTPEMMHWWSLNRNKERYKMVHPDHIEFKTLFKPEKSDVGTVFYHEEKHGRYMEKTRFVVEGISANTFDIAIRSRWFTRRTHLVFEAAPGGTYLSSTGIIGSDNPYWGRLWNWFTRKFLYTAEYRAACAKHGKDEFTVTPQILPKLFAEATGKKA